MPGSGSSKAAREQKKVAHAQTELARETEQKQRELLDPFMQAGLQYGLPGLTELSTPEGQEQFYKDYYQSPQFRAQADAARNQQLAAAEATGGVMDTSTANQLARISPTLGLQALESQRNIYGQLTNIGQAGAGGQASYIGQGTAAQTATLENLGRIRAAQAVAPYQTAVGAVGTGLQAYETYKSF